MCLSHIFLHIVHLMIKKFCIIHLEIYHNLFYFFIGIKATIDGMPYFLFCKSILKCLFNEPILLIRRYLILIDCLILWCLYSHFIGTWNRWHFNALSKNEVITSSCLYFGVVSRKVI